MLLFFLALFLSAADAPAALGASYTLCAHIVLPGDRPTALVALVCSRRAHRAAGRSQAPAASPAVRILLSPRSRAGALHGPPPIAPRAATATPSSERDPPATLV